MANATANDDMRAEIVVIGCGPVGAMLANLLGMQGLSTLVLEREASVYHLPCACHFDDEVMRLFQTVGFAEKVTNAYRFSSSTLNVAPIPDAMRGWCGSGKWHCNASRFALR